MKRKYWSLGALWIYSTILLSAQEVRVHTIGDSTMADYVENTTRTRGWGEMFQEFFYPEVEVINYARGGRSSRSFYQEGRWEKVKNNLRKGDYVLIQFAHNDEKEGGKDGADGRGTAPWTTYKSYLEKYVDETRSLGGKPIFVTPIVRRYFQKDGTISPKGCHDLSIAPDDSTLNYVRVMKYVAQEWHVPVVDMTASTKAFVEQLGETATVKQIYVPTDGTHTQDTGAACYAELAAEGLREKDILKKYIRTNVPLILNPTLINFDTIYAGDKATRCFDLTGLHLSPQQGTLKVKAPEGMTLTDSPESKDEKNELVLTYTDGKLWNKCFYLHYTPRKANTVSDYVTISYGDNCRKLPVQAVCKEVTNSQNITIQGKVTGMKGITFNEGKYTITGANWPADIDEAANRYVEIIIESKDKTLLVKQVSFMLDGDICYRAAYARGKDFYPRTDIGEAQRPVAGKHKIVLPIQATLQPHKQLHVRLFPWSLKATDNLYFNIQECIFEATEIQ